GLPVSVAHRLVGRGPLALPLPPAARPAMDQLTVSSQPRLRRRPTFAAKEAAEALAGPLWLRAAVLAAIAIYGVLPLGATVLFCNPARMAAEAATGRVHAGLVGVDPDRSRLPGRGRAFARDRAADGSRRQYRGAPPAVLVAYRQPAYTSLPRGVRADPLRPARRCDGGRNKPFRRIVAGHGAAAGHADIAAACDRGDIFSYLSLGRRRVLA